MQPMYAYRTTIALLLILACGGLPAAAAEPKPEDLEFFEKQVRPVLASRCFKCHGPKKQEAELRVDSRAALLQGGETGPAIVPGKPEMGFLIDAINYGEVYQMPPTGKLKKEEIEAITRWVRIGAPWPGAGNTVVAEGTKKEFNLMERAKHWSFQPIRNYPPPMVKQGEWPRGILDRFILARLESAGLKPAPEADRRTWMRRVSFDLIGLPPKPAELDAFVKDHSPDAFEKVVDHLLHSPHFGERWARHWLDLVRYAESRGHEFDYDTPNVWQYRDYVIRALNADVPYNQFTIEHIAGDLLKQPRLHRSDGFNESILGAGFWFLGEWVHSPVDVRKDEAERFDNMIDVMTKTFLGLTVGCARCHDHKFDPITQKDYYALYGFLQSSSYRQARFDSMETNRRIAEQLDELRRDARRRIGKFLLAATRVGLERLPDYLLAARESIQIGPQLQKGGKSLTSAYRRQVDQIALKHKLNGESLAHWVVQLVEAKRNDSHPLHAWAILAHDKSADKPGRVAELLKTFIDKWNRQQATADVALKRAKVIVDYASASGEHLLQDGVTFALNPLKPGDVILGDDPNQPVLEIVRYGSVRRALAFRGLATAPGTQRDAGRLGGWDRAGKTFRTPTFVIESDRVHYLVKGAGRAYAVVDSHRVNQGPLHGEFLSRWPAGAGGKARWITQKLARYKGHRAHLEFSPEGDADLQVFLVIQSNSMPKNPLLRPNRLIGDRLAALKSPSIKSAAEAFSALLIESATSLAATNFNETAVMAMDYAQLSDWLFRNVSWIAAANRNSNAFREFQAELSFIARKRRDLVGKIQRLSRTAPVMWDGQGEDERLFIRGNPKTLGDVVPRRFLEVFNSQPIDPVGKKNAAKTNAENSALRTPNSALASGSGRLELARQITDPSRNPFITRVIVNRVWHHLFGRGIVASVDNFGLLGKRPTHPKLLDSLATRFAAPAGSAANADGLGWSIKRLIRSIVLSSAYRMSSRTDAKGETLDPENLLLHRMPVRRLEAEAIRDSLLAISGRLDRKMYGPPVPVFLTPFMQGRGRPRRSGPLDGAGRRSIYIAIRRNFLSPMMLAFDMPIPFNTMGRRHVSNVPAQALIMMNDPFVTEQAGVWAKRVLAKQGLSPAERIRAMYLSAFARPPSANESAAALEFLIAQAKEQGFSKERIKADPRLWADLCHVLMNVKEFVFVR